MATVNLYLDARRAKADGTSLVKISVTVNRKVKYISTGIHIEAKHWDNLRHKVMPSHPLYRRLNNALQRMHLAAEDVLLSVIGHPVDLDSLCAQVSAAVRPDLEPKHGCGVVSNLASVFERFLSLKLGKTREQYECCLHRLRAFYPNFDTLRLDEVTKGWLMEFDSWMLANGNSPNTRADYMICLRAVYNYAIDESLTNNYPFRRFKVKKVRTAKRSLSVQDLRKLFYARVDDWQLQYLDFFKLTFMLIGINSVDLLNLTHDALRDGRIVYNRAKTQGLYSIKVEPEAMEIIQRNMGIHHLLAPMDRYTNYADYRSRVNKGLRRIGDVEWDGSKKTVSPWFPQLTTYWARHTWATIASSLDIPKDVIGAALGHSQWTVTDIYIDFDMSKVDAANRRVIDWVLYGKR